MAMGRGRCIMFLIVALSLACELKGSQCSTTHIVGDSQGWGFSVSYDNWASKNNFAAGDTIVFNYPAAVHNVVAVSEAGYKACKVPAGSPKPLTSGSDKLTLTKGLNYFICSIQGHCAAGMKLQVKAS